MDQFEDAIVGLLPRLRRFARALARHAADSDDLVQVTLERALGRRDQWQPGSRLDSWTMRIMKNAWIDETRSRARRRPVDIGGLAETLADGAVASPGQRDDAMAVTQALNQLPDDQRVAVALVLVEGLSYAEAAEVLEIPAGTLTSRLVRGRTALMGLLEA